MEDTSILAPLIDWAINLVSSLGYFGIFFAMTIEAASVPIPSELIMGLGGFLVYKQELAFIPVVFLGALGNMIGSLATYAYGYYGGRPVIRRFGKYLGMTEEKFLRVENWFQKYGDKIMFFSQMLPFVRSIISLPAGILKVNIIKFEIYTFLGALVWCTLLVALSASLGAQWETLLSYIDQFETIVIAVLAVLVGVFAIYKIYKWRRSKQINAIEEKRAGVN